MKRQVVTYDVNQASKIAFRERVGAVRNRESIETANLNVATERHGKYNFIIDRDVDALSDKSLSSSTTLGLTFTRTSRHRYRSDPLLSLNWFLLTLMRARYHAFTASFNLSIIKNCCVVKAKLY